MSQKKLSLPEVPTALVPAAPAAALSLRPPATAAWTVLHNLDEAIRLAELMHQAGVLPKIRSSAEVLLRMLAGAECGFGVFASLEGVHFIDGNAVIGAHLRAASIKRSARYDYEVIQRDDVACEVAFIERRDGQRVTLGRIRHTLEAAQTKKWHLTQAGKVKPPWEKTPANMLFARVLTDGFKTHCPDLSGGVVTYDPDEFDGELAAPAQRTLPAAPALPAMAIPLPDAGEIVDAEYTVAEPVGEDPLPAAPPPITLEQIDSIGQLFTELQLTGPQIARGLQARGVDHVRLLNRVQAADMIIALHERLRGKKNAMLANVC